MRKQLIYVCIALVLGTAPSKLMAAENNAAPPFENPKTEIPADIKNMIDRLNEIKEMDKSDLTASEKRELRREVRDIKKTIKKSGRSGIFISTGAIIIILLVLLII